GRGHAEGQAGAEEVAAVHGGRLPSVFAAQRQRAGPGRTGAGQRHRAHRWTGNVTHSRYTLSLHPPTLVAMGRSRSGADIRERFGDAVRAGREELGLTQEELAGEVGIHRIYLSDVERGSRNICLINIERMAEALDLSLADLFRQVESPGS